MQKLESTDTLVVEHKENNVLESDDPILKQLPRELLQYVSRPEDHKNDIAYVERGAIYSFIHLVFSILFFPYSVCRMILVNQGQLALTMNNGTPEILGPGRHVLLSPFNSFVGTVAQSDSFIKHGPLYIIRVEIGQIGFGIEMSNGKPLLLTRGTHIIRSNTFVWCDTINLRTNSSLKNIEIIRVETGNVAYCYRQGQLQILQPGLHLVQPPDRYGGTISTQITIIDLPFGVHETSDYVPLGIKSAVFYRVVDPLKALLRIQNINKQIQRK